MKNTKSISNNNSRSTNNNTIGRVVLVTGASGEIGMKIS